MKRKKEIKQKPGFLRFEARFFKSIKPLENIPLSPCLSAEGGAMLVKAGLLTCGSQRFSRLPRLFIYPVAFGERSPLTVARPSGICTRFPFHPGTPGNLDNIFTLAILKHCLGNMSTDFFGNVCYVNDVHVKN